MGTMMTEVLIGLLIVSIVVDVYIAFVRRADKLGVSVKKLSSGAIVPRKSTSGAAAYDVFIPKEVIVKPGRQIIPLDLAIELPYGYEAKIENRSGYASRGMIGFLLDSVESPMESRIDCEVLSGKIDSDYRGNIGVIVNNRDKAFYLPMGYKIAQLTIYQVGDVTWEEVETLSTTERGREGFGSTGTKML